MFDWPFKKKWKDSPPHLLLLSKFLYADSPENYASTQHWEAVLGENPQRAINRYIKEGMLEPAELPELIGYKRRASDLKTMLKERQLTVSGSKRDLIQRLIENDADGMRNETEGLVLYKCTPGGSQIVDNYLSKEKAAKDAAEKGTLESLRKRDIARAAMVVAEYERNRVFQRGLGVDWSNFESGPEAKSLQVVLTKTPAILKGMEENKLTEIRAAAGMMLLWGTSRASQWLPAGFESGIHLDGDTACRMLVFHAIFLRKLDDYIEFGAKTVEIVGGWDESTCPECRKIVGKTYEIDEVPELPYANCTNEVGCRCDVVIGRRS